jgi:integrase
MALTDLLVRNAKPKGKVYTLSDGGALYLFVMPNGSKRWRYRFRWLSKQQTFSVGSYPKISLAEARQERDRAKALIARGQHPTQQRRLNRIAQLKSQAIIFEPIAREYIESRKVVWSARYASRVKRFLEADVFPTIGSLPITDVTPAHLLEILRVVENRGSPTVATKLRIWTGGVFRHAIATGRANADPTYALRDVIQEPPTKHAPPLSRRRVPDLISALNGAEGEDPVLAIGLKLLMLTFVRVSEFSLWTFEQIDEKDALWRIPAIQMKRKQVPHLVPLSRQALSLIHRLKSHGTKTEFLFPSPTKPKQAISDPMWGKALKRLGFDGEISPHSFRATASTELNELGYASDWIERQLAHAPRNKTRASYNHAQYLPDRRKMMQEYADHLDELCRAASVSGILGIE